MVDETREICRDVRAFDAVTAAQASNEYHDHGYWEGLDVDKRWLVIGDNAVGDHWLLGPDGEVWFFDHNYGERAVHLFDALEIDATEWIMAAHVIGRTERDRGEGSSIGAADQETRLFAALSAISPDLAERWPYPLGGA